MGFETLVGNVGYERIHDGFGGYWEKGALSELIVLETALSPGVGTASTADLLPANSIIEAVTARVTTTLTDATEWSIGDEVTPNRFSEANSTLLAGTTVVGLNHVDQVGSSPLLGARQSEAGKVVVTTLTTPSAGVVRVVVYYRRFVAPTS